MKYIKLHIKFVIVHLLCFSNSKKRKKRFASQYEYDADEKKERARERDRGKGRWYIDGQAGKGWERRDWKEERKDYTSWWTLVGGFGLTNLRKRTHRRPNFSNGLERILTQLGA